MGDGGSVWVGLGCWGCVGFCGCVDAGLGWVNWFWGVVLGDLGVLNAGWGWYNIVLCLCCGCI